MAIRPILSRPNLAPLTIAFVLFTAIYVGYVLAMFSSLSAYRVLAEFSGGVSIAACLIPGFVLGFMAHRSPLMHGALLAIASGVVYTATLYFLKIPDSWQLATIFLFRWLSVSVPCCSLAALLGDYFGSRRASLWIKSGIVLSIAWLVITSAYAAFDYVRVRSDYAEAVRKDVDKNKPWLDGAITVYVSTPKPVSLLTQCDNLVSLRHGEPSVRCSLRDTNVALLLLGAPTLGWLVTVLIVFAVPWIRAGFRGKGI